MEKAILNILLQQTSFDFELIIANDASPDNSHQIISDIINTHEKAYLIKYVRHSENKGMNGNFLFALKSCSGKYIAVCEGDDFWTDKFKLQKQVDILENEPGFSVCFHNVVKLDQLNNSLGVVYDENQPPELTLKDLTKGKFIKLCSVLFRNDPILLAPIFQMKLPAEDTSLDYCLLQNNNKAYYISEVMSAYLIHPGGIWSMAPVLRKLDMGIDNFLICYKYFDDDILKPFAKNQLLYLLKQKFKFCLKRGNILSSISAAKLFIRVHFSRK